MPFKPTIYTKRDEFRASVDMARCRASIPDGGRSVSFHQCSRKAVVPWTDPDSGEVFLFCGGPKGHHPDAEVKRQAEAAVRSDEKFRNEMSTMVVRGIQHATDAQLLAEVTRRGLMPTAPGRISGLWTDNGFTPDAPPPGTPKLHAIDLSKSFNNDTTSKDAKQDHPDIATDGTVYLVQIDRQLFVGTFNRQWYGLNFNGWFGFGRQFDAPGTNSSTWEAIWRVEHELPPKPLPKVWPGMTVEQFAAAAGYSAEGVCDHATEIGIYTLELGDRLNGDTTSKAGAIVPIVMALAEHLEAEVEWCETAPKKEGAS